MSRRHIMTHTKHRFWGKSGQWPEKATPCRPTWVFLILLCWLCMQKTCHPSFANYYNILCRWATPRQRNLAIRLRKDKYRYCIPLCTFIISSINIFSALCTPYVQCLVYIVDQIGDWVSSICICFTRPAARTISEKTEDCTRKIEQKENET